MIVEITITLYYYIRKVWKPLLDNEPAHPHACLPLRVNGVKIFVKDLWCCHF